MQEIIHYNKLDEYGGYVQVVRYLEQCDTSNGWRTWKSGLKEWSGEAYVTASVRSEIIPGELNISKIHPDYEGMATVTSVISMVLQDGCVNVGRLTFIGSEPLRYKGEVL